MRDLVIATILQQFKDGLDELGIGMIIYEWEGRIVSEEERIEICKDLEGFLAKLSDEEILLVLDSQACDRYR